MSLERWVIKGLKTLGPYETPHPPPPRFHETGKMNAINEDTTRIIQTGGTESECQEKDYVFVHLGRERTSKRQRGTGWASEQPWAHQPRLKSILPGVDINVPAKAEPSQSEV